MDICTQLYEEVFRFQDTEMHQRIVHGAWFGLGTCHIPFLVIKTASVQGISKNLGSKPFKVVIGVI